MLRRWIRCCDAKRWPSGLWLALMIAIIVAATSKGSGPSDEPAAEPAERAPAQQAEIPEGPPIEGFQQLLPRNGIPALVDPDFVSAEEAKIPDDAWVLGFEHGGEAYAYSLNLLNHHEVVNHRAKGEPIAAVW